MSGHILFPTDFSERSLGALPHALSFAKAFNSEIHALYGSDHKHDAEAYKVHSQTIKDIATNKGVTLQITNISGEDVAELIVDEAKMNPPIVAVMATHGRAPLSKWMLGSITEQVLRYIQIPVVLVTPHAEKRVWEGIRTILVGIDFSLESHHALAWASLVAQKCNARVHVMHTIESGVFASTPFEFPSLTHLVPNAETTVNEAFKNFDSNIQFSTLPDHHVAHGIAHKELIRLAGEINADMIVIGPHGSGGMKDFLIGSTTDRVVRTASCPVLVAKTAPDKGLASI